MKTLIFRRDVAWATAIVLGLVNALPGRFEMNPDGIAYMNLASIYQHGDWASAINGYWSPLYPLLIAATLRIIPVSPFFESTVVHALNFVIYLGAFAAFRFFLSEIRTLQDQAPSDADREVMTFRSFPELACAYSLFYWAAFNLIGFALVTPDMVVALLVFTASGYSIRLKRQEGPVGYAALGAILGLAYLTKAIMFPVGVVMCLCCGFPATLGTAARRSAAAIAGFLLIASPQIFAMSRLAGHPSYGESGRIAYATEVNRLPRMWVGEPAGSGTPVHPMRTISRDPAAYEFSSSNSKFSYPAWDEPAYWSQGIRSHFSVREQLAVTTRVANRYVDVFGILIFAGLALYLVGKRRMRGRYVCVIAPALAAFAIYALVYFETRYVGAWIVVLFLCFAASLRFDRDSTTGVMLIASAVALFHSILFISITRHAAGDAVKLSSSEHPNAQFETAAILRKAGVNEGEKVGAIGYAANGYWARLAGVQIAMQVPDEASYSSATDSAQADIIRLFRDAGAVAVVSTGRPDGPTGWEWKPMGPAGYFVLVLSRH